MTTVADRERLLAAVADPSRRRLLDIMLADATGSSATALAAAVPFTRQAVTKHLAVLDRAGLVTGRRQGREVRYTVRPERVDQAARALAEVAASWDERLLKIKALSESSRRVSSHGARR